MSTLPTITLQQGHYYFTVDGRQRLIFSRNAAGESQSDYDEIFAWMEKAGSLVARVDLNNSAMGGWVNNSGAITGYGYDRSGNILPDWESNWKALFDLAKARGIYVLPFFTGWTDWNPDWHVGTCWDLNPLNYKSSDPMDLFNVGSPINSTWVNWLVNLITKWSNNVENILAWELYSEVNLTIESGKYVPEASAIRFIENAAQQARAADTSHRPITASLGGGGTNPWSNFYKSSSLDFIQIHPYEPDGNLDTDILEMVEKNRSDYQKPVLIGESGLSAGPLVQKLVTSEGYPKPIVIHKRPPVPPLDDGWILTNAFTNAARAFIGIKHAIWAGAVSGAMNARGLFWEDGWGIYIQAIGRPFLKKYAVTEIIATKFMHDVDMSKLVPLRLASVPTPGVYMATMVGGALGSKDMIIGWMKEARCVPPDWPVGHPLGKPVPAINSNVRISLPMASEGSYTVNYYDTATGTIIGTEVTSTTGKTPDDHGVSITLPINKAALAPDYTGDIAFKAYPIKP